MLDNSFGIFHNVSPRFQWSELDVPFQTDDRFFRFANHDAMLASKMNPVRRMKIKDAFLLLFSERASEERNLGLLRSARLTALDMQMLIHRSFILIYQLFPTLNANATKVLYTHLWASTFSNPLAHLPSTSRQLLLQPFKTAMSNWKLLWDEIKSSSLEKGEWNKLGFQRTAEGYFEAVKEVAESFERRGGVEGIKSDCEKGMHLRKILSF
jgi:hypothetical protein